MPETSGAVAPSWKETLLAHGAVLDHVDLDRAEVLTTWRALFDPRQPICKTAEDYIRAPHTAPPGWTPGVQAVSRWICGEDDLRKRHLDTDYQVEAWQTVVRELGRLQLAP